MDGIYFASSKGPLHLVGRIHTDPQRPVLLVVTGAFPPKELKHDFVEHFGAASVVVIRYPGMHATLWPDPSPLRVADGVDEVIQTWLKGRRIVAFGMSTGCLVTLNLQSPEVRRQIAVEPFLSTTHMDAFIEYSRNLMGQNPSQTAVANFVGTVFGITPTEVVNRDYRALRGDPNLPLDLIVGAIREPRGKTWPSFTLDEDRELLLARPDATLHVGPEGSGHWVETTPEAAAMVRECAGRALIALRPQAPAGA